MTRSSRHKSHKQSKHSSKGYSDSEEDVKMEKSSRDENSGRLRRESASGEKRKILSHVREGKDGKDSSDHGNGEVVEEYVSSKRRKEKSDAPVDGDRWNGGGEERGDTNRNVGMEINQKESSKVDSKSKESNNKGESLKLESKTKSKRYDTGSIGERKEDSLAPTLVDKEESKSKGEPKRRSERDSSGRKEGKELKDKDRRLEKEKNGGQESKHVSDEIKLVDVDMGKKPAAQSGELNEDRHGKRARANTERTVQYESRNSELEKENEKRMRRKREASSERDKHLNDSKDVGESRLSTRDSRAKDTKYKDDKQKDGSSADKHQEDGYKEERQRDKKYREEPEKDNKHWDDKYREDGEKEARHRDDRRREEGSRDNKRKDERHREDGDQDSRRKEKYRDGTERGHKYDKHQDGGDSHGKQKVDQYREDVDKDNKCDERYHDDGDRDARRRDESYRDDCNRDNRRKDERYREDVERDILHKDRKPGDDFEREKRPRNTKYRDEHISRDRSAENSDAKRSRDDGYAADHHSRKSSAYDDSPTHDDRASRYRDDQGRRKPNEKEDYGDGRSRSTKDQRSNAEKKSTNDARIEPVIDRGRSTSRNADIELTSSHSRRRSSPSLSSHDARDHYRVLKQDESKYRDYNYDERSRHSISSARDYAGTVGGTEKTSSSRSLEKLGQKGDGHLGEFSAERHFKSDFRSSPLQRADKSPSSGGDRRQFSRADVRRNIDGESTHRMSGGSRDAKDYSSKEGRGSRELAMDVLPGDEFSQGDADTLSVSSPFARNNHFSSSSKSLPPPPPFRTGVDSPLPLGTAEDDSRGKSNSRLRRIGDPNMGRIQGNPWRGVPSWPSPVANGFLPFPHAPPPVGFHSVMQPFPAPPMFGVRPSMELNHSSPYHMSDADRFPGPVRPMGWRNQVDDSSPQFNAWDANHSVFDESHMYGRPNWGDPSRNLPGGRGWDTSGDLWKGSNRTASLEMASSEKENNSMRSADETLAGQSIQQTQYEQNQVDEQAESTEISQSARSTEKNDIEAPLVSLDENSDVAKISREDEVSLSHFYFSKLDISADLAVPELFSQCTSMMNMDQSVFSDMDDSKILYVEEALEAKVAPPHKILNTLFPSSDDSIFQKAMRLYKKQKENFKVEIVEKPKALVLASHEEHKLVDDMTEKLHPLHDMCGVEDTLPNFDVEVDAPINLPTVDGYVETSQQEIDLPLPADVTEKLDGPVAIPNNVVELDQVFDKGQQENDVKDKPISTGGVEVSDAVSPSVATLSPPAEVSAEYGDNSKEVALLDTKCEPLLNSDSFPEVEAMIMSGSVNLSRIHHSPESTR